MGILVENKVWDKIKNMDEHNRQLKESAKRKCSNNTQAILRDHWRRIFGHSFTGSSEAFRKGYDRIKWNEK